MKFPLQIKFDFLKLLNRVNLRILVLAVVTSGLVLIVQQYLWPDAGKRIENRQYIYSFQMDYWLQEVYKEFNVIRSSGTYRNISLTTGKKTLTTEYLENIQEYHYQVRQLLQILRYQAHVTTSVMSDTDFLIKSAPEGIVAEKQIKIIQDYKKFETLAEKHIAMEQAIESFSKNITKIMAGIPQDATLEQRVDQELKILNTLRQLYSDEHLMLTYSKDPFEFLRDFNKSSQDILEDYDVLVNEYNDMLMKQAIWKNALLVILTIVAGYLTIIEATKPTPESEN